MKGQAERVAFLVNGIKQRFDYEEEEDLEELEIESDPKKISLELDWKTISYDNLLTIQTQGGATSLDIASVTLELAWESNKVSELSMMLKNS